MDKKLTINDIAKMSGVAKSTVSRYLNGGSVRPSTGQKIKKIIEEKTISSCEPIVCPFKVIKSLL